MGEQKLSDIPGLHWKEFQMPKPYGLDADTPFDRPLMEAEEAMEVKQVLIIPQDGISGGDDGRTRKVINVGSNGAGSTVVAEKTYGAGDDLAAYVPDELTLSGTEANLRLAKGDVLKYESAVTESGVAEGDFAIRIAFLYKLPPTS